MRPISNILIILSTIITIAAISALGTSADVPQCFSPRVIRIAARTDKKKPTPVPKMMFRNIDTIAIMHVPVWKFQCFLNLFIYLLFIYLLYLFIGFTVI